MSGITHDYMEEYIRSLIPKACDKYKELEDFAKENKVIVLLIKLKICII